MWSPVKWGQHLRWDIPASSSMATVGLRTNGTGTCVGGAESDLDVGGRYWYSIKVNLPSGGTKDNALSRFHR